ncbi:MAG: hypothetical protein IH845_02070 [Nanoarchaeota archaeon]|nr:hypothetical protein [Nanoarchaeota archaeon]
MAAKKTVVDKKIKQVGYFNYKDLYGFIFDYIKGLGYVVKEKKYEEKETAGGKEVVIEWNAFKKMTDYYRGRIQVKWHILNMKDAEIERDGRKEQTNKGEVKIEFKGIMERDYEDKWEDTPFWKYMRGTYDKYIAKTLNDEYEDDLEDEVNDIIEQTKAFLQLQTA